MKILCIVQARMGSSRLPGKVLKEINNNPMIYYTLTRLKKSRYIDEIVLATSDKEIDNSLAEYVEGIGFEVFRGSEENVLERYKETAEKYCGDIVIRVTGDCPLIDPIVVDNAITKFLMYKNDYLRLDVPETFVRGFDVEVFTREVLNKVYNICCKDNNDSYNYNMYREHVTYYIYKHPKDFNIGFLRGEEPFNIKLNLSVDREEDFEIVRCILENSYINILGENIDIRDIVRYCHNYLI